MDQRPRMPIHPDDQRMYAGCPRSVPMAALEPHRRQAFANHGQTLERLAERGGLSLHELYAVMNDLHWTETASKSVKSVLSFAQSIPGAD